MASLKNDIQPGMLFAQLTVVERGPNAASGGVRWFCLCACGKRTLVSASSLRKLSTKSCGCIQANIKKNTGTAARIYNRYKHRALTKGISFELEPEIFNNMILMPCHYCGDEPSNYAQGLYKQNSIHYNGIDRVDSSLGYVRANVVPCCKSCNTAKLDRSYDDFITWVYRIQAKYERARNIDLDSIEVYRDDCGHDVMIRSRNIDGSVHERHYTCECVEDYDNSSKNP